MLWMRSEHAALGTERLQLRAGDLADLVERRVGGQARMALREDEPLALGIVRPATAENSRVERADDVSDGE